MSGFPSVLEVVETRDAGAVRVRLRGELDLATSPLVQGRLGELGACREPTLLDLEELTFIDASGIGLVVTAAQAAARDGWLFAITPGSDPVRRLFEIVGLDDGQLPIKRSTAGRAIAARLR